MDHLPYDENALKAAMMGAYAKRFNGWSAKRH
jgi:hypothetical protein